MKNRITKNEERLDSLIESIKSLNKSLESFKKNKKNYKLLNDYYGSKEWFKDKDDFEKSKISNIKAGVLSEDAVWNMNEEVSDLIDEMKSIIKDFGD